MPSQPDPAPKTLGLKPPPPEAIPAGFEHFLTSNAGLHWFVRYTYGASGEIIGKDFACYHDVQPILDHNARMMTQNDGWSVDGKSKGDKLLRRCASVPWGVRYQWKAELGVDYNDPCPDMQRKVDQLLDSSDFSKLRTAHFRIGKQTAWV